MEVLCRGDKNGQIQIFKIHSIFEPLYFVKLGPSFVALALLQFKKFPLNLVTFRQKIILIFHTQN